MFQIAVTDTKGRGQCMVDGRGAARRWTDDTASSVVKTARRCGKVHMFTAGGELTW